MLRRLAYACLFVLTLCVFANSTLSAQDAARQIKKPQFTVSRETTFFTAPLRPNGSVDYFGAINAHFGKGVASESNAGVLLCQVCKPLPEMNRAFFRELGIEPPPANRTFLGYFDVAVGDERSDAQRVRILQQIATGISHPWQRRDFPQIAEWLDQHEKRLRLVHAAARREKYFTPLVSGEMPARPVPLIAALTPVATQSRHVARVLCLRAMMYLGEGDHQSAWNDLVASRRIGRLVSRGPTVVEANVGFGIEEMSHDAMLTLLQVAPPNGLQAKAYRDQLLAMPPIARIVEKVDVTERCVCLDTLLVMAWQQADAIALLDVEPGLAAAGKMVRRFWPVSADWDAALHQANSRYDGMVANLRLPKYSDRNRAFDQLRDDWNGRELLRDVELDAARSTKVLGDVVAAQFLSSFIRARIAEDRARQSTRNLEVALALAAYHADHENFPAELTALMPTYLDEIPADVFTGKVPIYRRQESGYLLYSVGEDRRDDGGSESTSDDLSVRIYEHE